MKMKKKRIAFISEHASPITLLGGVDAGGQNVYVAELARNLVKLNYTVDIFTRSVDPGTPRIINWLQDIRVIHLDAGPAKYIAKESLLPYMTEFRENLIRFMNAEGTRYDIIHATFWMSALVAMELKLLFSIPFIVTFHSLGRISSAYEKVQDEFPTERVSIEQQSIKLADHLIATCPQNKEDLINHYNADPQKITIIPCGVNPAEFYPVNRSVARKLLGLANDEFIVLQVCRMISRKGVDNIIRSIPKLIHLNQKVRLIVVGGESTLPGSLISPEIGRLQEIAREEGVYDQVVFAGRQDRNRLRYYYSAANVFVTTPWYEPFGITILEAMACGTPVIGSEVGAIKYLNDDGKSGFLVPPDNPDSLALKVGELMKEQSVIQEMKKNALQRVHIYFRWQTIAAAVSAKYEQIIVTRFSEMIKKRSLGNRNQPVDA